LIREILPEWNACSVISLPVRRKYGEKKKEKFLLRGGNQQKEGRLFRRIVKEFWREVLISILGPF